jgi:hypothetical protein
MMSALTSMGGGVGAADFFLMIVVPWPQPDTKIAVQQPIQNDVPMRVTNALNFIQPPQN